MNKEILQIYRIKPFDMEVLLYFTKKPDASKLNKNEKIKKYLKRVKTEELDISESDIGSVFYNKDKRPVMLFIRIGKNKNYTLIHELVHLVDFLSNYFEFQDEMEFRAYILVMLYKDFKKLLWMK